MRMGADTEFDQFLLHLRELPPEDQRFLGCLVTELSSRVSVDDAEVADEKILEVTREIDPERVPWVAGRLGYC